MLTAGLNWLFPLGDENLVPGMGYKSLSTQNVTFYFSDNNGERPYKGAFYLIVSGDFEVKLVMPSLSEVGKFSSVRTIYLPAHAAIGLLCHSVSPLAFSITQLTGTINLFIEHSSSSGQPETNKETTDGRLYF